VFGRQFQQRLADARALMVGAGALGCEFAKGFAMLGAFTGTPPPRALATRR
jgi:molybdopterin/thiamine biosynthesis adenylyltransferase